MHEYTYSRCTTVLLSILLAPFVIMALFIPAYMVIGEVDGTYYVLAFFELPLLALCLFCVNDLFSKVTIDQYSIRYASRLYSRELLWQDVKGFRSRKDRITIVPHSKNLRKVYFSSYIEGGTGVLRWVEARFPDLDKQEVADTYQKAVRGGDSKVVGRQLKSAKKALWILNGAALVLSIGAGIWGDRYRWIPCLLMCMVPIALYVLIYFNGLIKISAEKDDPAPSLALTIIIIAFGLFWCVFDINTLDRSRLWPVVGSVTAVLTALLVYFARKHRLKTITWIMTVLMYAAAFFGAVFGAVLHLNRMLDHTPPEIFTTVVYDKYISRGKSTSYHLRLEPCARLKGKEQITVRHKYYDRVQVNEKIDLVYYPGAFGISWYMLADLDEGVHKK